MKDLWSGGREVGTQVRAARERASIETFTSSLFSQGRRAVYSVQLLTAVDYVAEGANTVKPRALLWLVDWLPDTRAWQGSLKPSQWAMSLAVRIPKSSSQLLFPPTITTPPPTSPRKLQIGKRRTAQRQAGLYG
ncbi:unnamed protein product [Arctogadus glacialis]